MRSLQVFRNKRHPKPYQWRRTLHYFYHRFVRLKGSPEAIARGLAMGIFSGCFPWFGLQIVIAIALATLARGNKIIAAAATWVSNPFTSLPILAVNFHVGQWILGSDTEVLQFVEVNSWQEIKLLGTDFLVTLLVGSCVIGGVLAIGSYFLGLWLIRRVRHRRSLRRKSKS